MPSSSPNAPRVHQALFQTLCDNAQAAGAKEICLRGPKECGKTTLLTAFGAHLRAHLSDYPLSLVVEWDLRQNTPLTDEEFRLQMGAKLADALSQSDAERHPKLAALMRSDERYLKNLGAALSLLDKPVAFLIDNHDAVLDEGEVSIAVWSELNSFLEAKAGLKKLRIFATSRVPLQDLARGEEERSSPYFSRLQVEPMMPFGDADLKVCLGPLEAKEIALDDAAQREILKWTGGAPVLVTRLLEAIDAHSGETSKVWSEAGVHTVAEGLQERIEHLLGAHWHRASAEVKGAFVALSQGQITVGQVLRPHRMELERRGWLWGEGNAAVPTQFIANYVTAYGSQSSQLPGLFGSENRWEAHFPELLKLRLEQVEKVDADLKSRTLRAINVLLIDKNPYESLEQMRFIARRALQLIWHRELTDGRFIPREWGNFVRGQEISNSLGAQISVLRIVTGTMDNERLAQFVTKPTYLLLSQVQAAGDFYNHPEDQETAFGVAAALCLSAVELCAALGRDLKN